MNKVYNYEDLFQDIPGDPDNFLFTIPPEMLEETGWKTGDTLNISMENGAIVLSKKDTTVT
jgi:bifunctional DNA-binding transcriptional regulator/antitoxin component of YhaV-PrlF toxin-antitoxin module